MFPLLYLRFWRFWGHHAICEEWSPGTAPRALPLDHRDRRKIWRGLLQCRRCNFSGDRRVGALTRRSGCSRGNAQSGTYGDVVPSLPTGNLEYLHHLDGKLPLSRRVTSAHGPHWRQRCGDQANMMCSTFGIWPVLSPTTHVRPSAKRRVNRWETLLL